MNSSISSGTKPSYNRFSGGNRRTNFSARPRFRGTYISPEKFINKAIVQAEQPAYQPQNRFRDFHFVGTLQRNIEQHGYVTPTPIQDQAIAPILAGQDLLGLANTGTGKTAAFLLPIIQLIHADPNLGTALIIVPTRELALQIDMEFRAFIRDMRLYSAVCVGGANIFRQISTLRRKPHVIIGTPGRLKDLADRGDLNLSTTRILVLDEADRMLDMGFSKDINVLVDMIPQNRQTLCFSATITETVKGLVDKLLKEHQTISVCAPVASSHIDQDVVRYNSPEHRLDLLIQMLTKAEYEKVLIFGETKRGVQKLSEKLMQSGITAEAIHGNKSQPQRQRALQAFRDNNVKALVATDVAARGLDISDISHVINYDQPNTFDDYVHRIGRTGRAGKTGKALTFVQG
ncbi:MAG: DEAD/DEAH box helicase [Patescibacteria group bacterium]|jgi:superfamily II DNA/RNA helicase